MRVNVGEAVKRLLYTPEEARTALSISARKLWSLTASNELPHIKIGRSVRYPAHLLEEWIAAHTKGGDGR